MLKKSGDDASTRSRLDLVICLSTAEMRIYQCTVGGDYDMLVAVVPMMLSESCDSNVEKELYSSCSMTSATSRNF